MPGDFRQRPSLPKSRNRAVDHAVIVHADRIVIDAELGRDAGPKRFHHHVGAAQQPFRHRLAFD